MKIKVGQQTQANLPIYLLHTGIIQCGKFKYQGRYKKKFKDIYAKIRDLTKSKPANGILDVSGCKYWDAINIYHEHIVVRWCKSISAARIEQYANETEIMRLLEPVKIEFHRAVRMKWRQVFKKCNPLDPQTPRQAWQILRN